MDVKEFVLGKGKVPDWFTEKCSQGRAKINYSDEGEISSATIHTPTKTIVARIGDGIMLIKSGLQVIPKDKLKKYKGQKAETKNEIATEDKEDME